MHEVNDNKGVYMSVTWILVAQGSCAKVLQVLRNGKEVSLIKEFAHEKTAAKGIDINTDRQGRSFESSGPMRHAMDVSEDIKDHERRVFAKEIAEFLSKAIAENKLSSLILVASPNLLGALRKAMPQSTHKYIKHELGKDLMSQSLKDHELVEKIRDDLDLACF